MYPYPVLPCIVIFSDIPECILSTWKSIYQGSQKKLETCLQSVLIQIQVHALLGVLLAAASQDDS